MVVGSKEGRCTSVSCAEMCVRVCQAPNWKDTVPGPQCAFGWTASSATTTMASSILDPSAVLSAEAKLLPPNDKRLASPQDALAALLHTLFTVLSFRLIAVDESSSTQSYPGNVLPDRWNKDGPGSYTFRYRHDQSSLEFLLKVSKLGSRTLVHAIALEVGNVFCTYMSCNDLFIS